MAATELTSERHDRRKNMTKFTTTLNQIRAHHPCTVGWQKLHKTIHRAVLAGKGGAQ